VDDTKEMDPPNKQCDRFLHMEVVQCGTLTALLAVIIQFIPY